jgi:hypothetical protein
VRGWERVPVFGEKEAFFCADCTSPSPRLLFPPLVILQTLLECYYMVERYDRIEGLIDAVPESSPLLNNMGRKLQSVGMTEAAAHAFLKAGDYKAAVDCCVVANHWDTAVDLAHRYQLPQVEGLLARYVSRLLEQNKTFAAVELYRKANRDIESAKMLANLGQEAAKAKVNPMRAKQFFVLAAMEVERHRKRTMDVSGFGAATTGGGPGSTTTAAGARTAATTMVTAATLDTLMREDAESQRDVGGRARTLDAAWRGAEAFHFFMLAQRQLYAGSTAAALVTASRLAAYEDVLDPRDVHSLIALAAYYAGRFGTASRALIRLEHMDSLTPAQQDAYSQVAFAIFTRNRPIDPTPQAEVGGAKGSLVDDDTVFFGGPNSRGGGAAGSGGGGGGGGNTTRACPTASCAGRIGPFDISCSTCRATFPACVVTGAVILTVSNPGSASSSSSSSSSYLCPSCRHRATAESMKGRSSCALCHAPSNLAGGTTLR